MIAPDGGPAFPCPFPDASLRGMTLRDWFAGQALSALPDKDMHEILMSGSVAKLAIPMVAKLSYQLADAMLAERAKGGAT